MRHFTSALTVAALLLVAAASMTPVDAEKLSINRQHSHNAKRVKAKLHHLSGARSMLVKRQQRLKGSEIDARTPAMKATQADIAKETAVIKTKIADAQSRKMVAQSTAGSNMTNVTARNVNPGLNSGVKQFFDAPHCNSASTFRVLETRFHDVCARTDMSFVTRHWYDMGRANNAYDKFCTSACAGTINDLLQHTEGYSCFEPDVLTELRLFSAMCQISPQAPPASATWKDTRCGAEVAVSGVFDGVTSSCESPSMLTSQSNCRMDASCQWDRDLQLCQEKVTIASIQKQCTPCYTQIVDVVSSDFNSICAKNNDQFCLPKMFQFNAILSNYSFDFSKDMIAATCADPLMVPCFRSQNVGLDNKDIAEAREMYSRCIESGVISQTMCAANFQRVLQRIDTNSAFWSQLCAKNTTTAPGTPSESCYRISQGLNGAAYNSCPFAQSNMSSCDTACSMDNGRFLEEAGCCAAYVDYTPKVLAAQFPVLPAEAQHTVNPADLMRVNTDYTFFNVSKLEMCSNGKKLFDWSAASCTNPWSMSAPITFWTILNHAAVQAATAEQRDGLMFAMKLDIGKAAGVIVNEVSVSLAAKTSNSTGVVGTEVSFMIRGTPQYINSAKAQWEASAATRVMTRSDEFVRECRTCKPDTEASIVPKTFDKIPGAPIDPCNTAAFYTEYKAMVTSCSGNAVDAVFSLTTDDLSKANIGWNAACDSQCLVEFKKIKAGPYKTCVPTEVSTLGDLINVGCTKDKDNNRCGAVLSVMAGADCGGLDQNACNSASTCRWNMKSGVCKDQFSEAFLKPKCEGGCITRMAATIGMNGDSFGKEARLLDNLFCSHDNGTLCLPMVQNQINTIDEFGLTSQVVTGLCGSGGGPKLRCMKRVYTAIATDSINWAEEDFYHCVETVMDDSTVSHSNKINRIEVNCIENVLAATISAVDQTTDMLNNMCSKNSNGDYCMQFPHKYENNTCISNMLGENLCPANCMATIDAVIADVGCCSGNLQDVYGFLPFANLPEEDIPEFEVFEDYGDDFGAPMVQTPQISYDFQGPQPGSAGGGPGVGAVTRGNQQPSANEESVVTPKWYFFSNYQTCVGGLQDDGTTTTLPKHNAGDLVFKKCKKVRGGRKETRSLPIGVSHDSITAKPKTANRASKKTKADVGMKTGMAGDDFPSFDWKKDDKRSINLGAAPSGRRATTTSATSAEIAMQTENDGDTAASAAAYDQAVASGSLTLSGLISLVKNECNNCTATGTDWTSVSTTSTSATLTAQVIAAANSGNSGSSMASSTASNTSFAGSPTGSGVAATSVVAALLAAVIIALTA